jgi:DNA repair photolyase
MRTGRIISTNTSPDVPFDRSINPYQGCEHGCIYCYARPSHSYLDLSPGLDFETRIFYKPDAAVRLAEEWEKPGYVCKPITIGANTDPYQPAERSTRVTRELLELFLQHSHPVSVITKSNLITRDLDLYEQLVRRQLCSVAISVPGRHQCPDDESRAKARNGAARAVGRSPLASHRATYKCRRSRRRFVCSAHTGYQR